MRLEKFDVAVIVLLAFTVWYLLAQVMRAIF